jgi:hypothetical protein
VLLLPAGTSIDKIGSSLSSLAELGGNPASRLEEFHGKLSSAGYQTRRSGETTIRSGSGSLGGGQTEIHQVVVVLNVGSTGDARVRVFSTRK